MQSFFREDVIVPGGVELGVYPASFWLASTDSIERVVRACVAKHATVRDGYQARLWSFCSERLGSWLLLKRLRAEVASIPGSGIEWLGRRRWRRRFVGQLNLVTEGAPTPATPAAPERSRDKGRRARRRLRAACASRSRARRARPAPSRAPGASARP